MGVTVFGIRHHGPGCARSLRRALDELRPDAVVMEGPPDAAELLSWVAHVGLKPPVAILVYQADLPHRAAYFPFAVFSPEWQTLVWAAENTVPVRFMDLPQSHQLALDMAEEDEANKADEEPRAGAEDAPQGGCERRMMSSRSPASQRPATEAKPADDLWLASVRPAHSRPPALKNRTSHHSSVAPPQGDSSPPSASPTWRTDPLALMAEAAGYKDHELWWEHQIERRNDATDLFAAIHEGMCGVRAEYPEVRVRDLQREAFMRKTLRAVVKEGFANVAAVCGAWHAPVLDDEAIAGKRTGCKIKDDNERLSGLPKVKTTATWIPWTYSRLTYRSGYGAGIHSPGWYGHLWESNDDAPTRWLATAARLLRENDLDASSASLIEARRLADALAAMRELRSPGLAELNEAILTVLCHGEPAPLTLIRARLEIGDLMGEIPPEAPAVPLAQDVAKLQTSLRLKPGPDVKRIDLDLRKENDLARSRLLHRLTLLNVPWGRLEHTGGKRSTFHEVWLVLWQPEFALAVIEANVWGSTVEMAATAKVVHDAQAASELAALTMLLESSIFAGLESAVDPLLAQIQARAAVGADVRHLMNALPSMARVARYGDVRGTQAAHVEPIFVGMFERALVGLAAACSALDDDAALRMVESMAGVNESLQILNRDDLQTEWRGGLDQLMRKTVHAMVRGWCCRLLLDARTIPAEELYRLARLSLSSVNPPAECAAWATGLLRGSGMALLHQDALWQVFDRWLSELSGPVFVEMMPLLRRAFADFTGPERRQMGEKVKHLRSGSEGSRVVPGARDLSTEVDHERAARVLPILAQVLGLK